MYKKVVILGAESFIGFQIARRMVNLGFLVIAIVDAKSNIWRLREIGSNIEIVKINDFLNNKIIVPTIKSMAPNYLFFVSSFLDNYLNSSRNLIYQNELFFFHEFLNDLEEAFFETLIFVGDCPVCKDSIICSKTNIRIGQVNVSASNCIPSILVDVHKNNMPVFVVRPGIIYGEYFSEGSIFGQFILSAVISKKFDFDLSIIKKDFINSRDFSNFLINLMLSKPADKALFDCNNGSTVSFNLFLEIFRSNFSGIDLSRFNKQFFEKINKFVSPIRDSTEGCFSWDRVVSFEFGLTKTFRWAKNNINFYKKSPNIFLEPMGYEQSLY